MPDRPSGRPKFTPLDLRTLANAGPELGRGPDGWRWAPDGPKIRSLTMDDPPSLAGFTFGSVRFWGIPFDVPEPARNDGRTWLALSAVPNAGLPSRCVVPLEVPVEAGCLVVAHFTDVEPPDARVGDLIGEYTVVFASGHRQHWPIRRHFEINARHTPIGVRGYATVSQLETVPVRAPRAERDGLTGQASNWGQTAHTGLPLSASGQHYWLWGGEIAAGNDLVVAVEFAALTDDVVAIAAVTLAHDPSNPLRRSRRTGIQIHLPRAEAADAEATSTPAPGLVAVQDVLVGVDLGQIVRIGEQAGKTTADWQADGVWGWGQREIAALPTTLYAELTAADAAEVRVDRGQRSWTIPWQEIIAGAGRSTDGQVRIEVVDPPLARLRVRVVDADSGRELPTRVHFHGAQGQYLPPRGHSPDINVNWCEDIGGDLRLGATNYAYVPGRFELDAPIGKLHAEVVRGFEYTPVRNTLEIVPGQSELTLPLRRAFDGRREGYYSGDVHVHFLDPTTAALEATAEDLQVTELLAAQWGRLYTNVEHGIGQDSPTSTPEHLIRVDSENRHHLMGHLFLLGLREPILPLSSGGPSEDEIGGWDEVALAEWCDRTHQQGGLVVTQFVPTPHAEVVAGIVLGKIDATEVRWFDFPPYVAPGGHWGETPFAFPGVLQWYRYLNCGYRVPAVAGTDKMTNAIAVGALRTYARLAPDEPFTYAAWHRAIKSGRTFVTTGPLLHLEVEGRTPGDQLDLPSGGGTLQVIAQARSTLPFEFIEIVKNGVVVARTTAAAGGRSARLAAEVSVTESCWIAARCYGREKLWLVWPTDVGAHTSPVYVTVGGKRQVSAPDASYLLTLMEGGLAYLDTLAAWRDEAQRERHRNVFRRGRDETLRHHPNAHPHWHPPGPPELRP
jgi:hypothetical protein